MNSEKIKLKEVHNGFSERDIHSKAILNQDKNALLRYKIQRNRLNIVTSTSQELKTMREEFDELKTEITELKSLLQKIARGLE